MRFKSLDQLHRGKPLKIELDRLPDAIPIDRYALEKAFKISELVTEIYGESVEWYGFTIGQKAESECIIDIAIPRNEQNIKQYTSVEPAVIAQYQDSLPEYLIINGWIHSHASLEFKRFSGTDEQNSRAVLEYVSPLLRKPVAKKEIVIENWAFLVEKNHDEEDLKAGNVSLITDVPVSSARLLETVYGSFCYCLVIGDDGWHEQQIWHKRRGILTGETIYETIDTNLAIFDSGRKLSKSDILSLSEKVKENIHPVNLPPPERLERM